MCQRVFVRFNFPARKNIVAHFFPQTNKKNLQVYETQNLNLPTATQSLWGTKPRLANVSTSALLSPKVSTEPLKEFKSPLKVLTWFIFAQPVSTCDYFNQATRPLVTNDVSTPWLVFWYDSLLQAQRIVGRFLSSNHIDTHFIYTCIYLYTYRLFPKNCKYHGRV